MSLPNLDNLVQTGQLKTEPMNEAEFMGEVLSSPVREAKFTVFSLSNSSTFNSADARIVPSPVKYN